MVFGVLEVVYRQAAFILSNEMYAIARGQVRGNEMARWGRQSLGVLARTEGETECNGACRDAHEKVSSSGNAIEGCLGQGYVWRVGKEPSSSGA